MHIAFPMRLVVLGIMALGVAAMLWAPLAYLNWRHEDSVQHRVSSDQLARLKTRLATLRQIKVEVEQNETSSVFQGDYLQGASDQLILADLQAKLKKIIAQHACQLLSARILPTTNSEGITMIGLRLAIRGGHLGIQKLVYAIETQQPYLFITRASIEATSQVNGTKRQSADTSPTMALTIDLIGAVWPGVENELGEPR